jgi:branched-chain amino acid transport system permease protein
LKPSGLTWLAALGAALVLPVFVQVPYYESLAITGFEFVALAVSYDIVVGRIGALSLAQPVFLGFGAYVAALTSIHLASPFPLQLLAGCLGSAAVAFAIGIPCFRLSEWTFAIGTLGFTLSAQLVAQNWVDVTGGQLCISRIPDATIPLPGGSLDLGSLPALYYVILTIAAVTVGTTAWLARSRVGLAFTAVRDNPILADARGVWPNAMRLVAFALSAGFAGAVGVFTAHFQTVVCPTVMDPSLTATLLIMVFVGGRGSLRGVVTAALLISIVPQILQVAEAWRLVLFGALLLIAVLALPGGIESMYAAIARRVYSLRTTPGVPL